MDLALRLVKQDPISGYEVAQTAGPDPWYSVHECLRKCPIWARKNPRSSALWRVRGRYGAVLDPLIDYLYLPGRNKVPTMCMQLSGLALLLGALNPTKRDLTVGKGGKRAREEDEEDDFLAGCGPIPEAAPSPDTELQILQAKIKLRELDVEMQRETRMAAEAQLALIEAQKRQSTAPRSPRASPRSPSPAPPKPKQPASDDRPQYATEAMSSFTALFHEVVNRRVSKIQFALAAQHVAQQYHQAYKKQPEMRAKHHMYPNSCADNVKKWVWEWIRERALGKRARSDCA